MTVKEMLMRLHKNRVELDSFSRELCVHPNIDEFEFNSIFSQVINARRMMEFSILFLERFHPDMKFSWSEFENKQKAEIKLLFKDKRGKKNGEAEKKICSSVR